MKGCRPLSNKEIEEITQSFYGKFSNRDKALFFLGIKTGFRISEILSLRIRDVFQNGKVVDRVSVARSNMKMKTEGRTVPLHPAAIESIRCWLEDLKKIGDVSPDAFVFQSRKRSDRAIGRVQAYRVLCNVFKEIGLTGNLGTHTMRKTFAANVHNAVGGNILMTQRALGHRNINSTVSYLQSCDEDIERAILES